MFRDDAASVNAWDDDENEPAGFNDDGDLQQPMDVDGAVEDFFVGDQAPSGARRLRRPAR